MNISVLQCQLSPETHPVDATTPNCLKKIPTRQIDAIMQITTVKERRRRQQCRWGPKSKPTDRRVLRRVLSCWGSGTMFEGVWHRIREEGGWYQGKEMQHWMQGCGDILWRGTLEHQRTKCWKNKAAVGPWRETRWDHGGKASG